MIILDKPYVSDFLKDSIVNSEVPVLDNETARQALAGRAARLVSDSEFVRLAKEQGSIPRIYANSENAIDWIDANLGFCSLPDKIDVFKNKLRMRELLADRYPNYQFRGAKLEALAGIDAAELRFPLVLKPAVGFFSLGVRVVERAEDWNEAVSSVTKEAADARAMYPAQVLDLGNFLIEDCIQGEEFAVDAYYDADGNVTVLNILGHLFASAKDVSDRVYMTSASIIEKWREPFASLLQTIGERAGLRNFPVHAELRVDPERGVIPIELNPMRFAGWCCTDIAYHAYGIDPYQYYLEGRAPQWGTILEQRKGKVWALVVADLPSELDRSTIESVDYDAFLAQFNEPLELRPVDYKSYCVFAFLIAAAQEEDLSDLRRMLGQDMTRYLRFA